MSPRTALVALAATAALAQSPTHLNVPAKQLVNIMFVKGPGDLPFMWTGFYLYRPDGSVVAANKIPAGQALVIRELGIRTALGNGNAPTPTSLQVTCFRMDAGLVSFTSEWDATFPNPGNGTFVSYSMTNDTGMAIAPPARPKVNITAAPIPDTQVRDETSIMGWGYLVAY